MGSGQDVDIWLVQLYNHLNLLNTGDVFAEAGEFPVADNGANRLESSPLKETKDGLGGR